MLNDTDEMIPRTVGVSWNCQILSHISAAVSLVLCNLFFWGADNFFGAETKFCKRVVEGLEKM